MQMKFQELRQYAKQLGLTDIKKSMNKEQIIEAINKYKENLKPLAAESNVRVKKTKTKSKTTKDKNEVEIEETSEEPKQIERQTRKKKTKKSEHSENVNEPEKTSVLKATENVQEEIVKENNTKTKKTKRGKKEDEQVACKEETNQENEVISSKEQTKKKKVSKKGSKENKQNVEEHQEEVENKKPKKTKKTSSKKKRVETQPSTVNANLHEDSQETKDFKLELDDDETSQQAAQEPALAFEHHNNLNNSSILTNDLSRNEDVNEAKLSTINQDPNITEDIQNNTFDKSKPDFNPIQNKTQTICVDSTVVVEQPIPSASNNPIEPSTFVPCTSFYKQQTKEVNSEPVQSNIQPAEEAVASPKPQPKQGGARIVRPKQTITEIKIFKKGNNEVEEVTKRVVEVVKNEAGPRIVKPTILYANEVCETTESNKRKLNENVAKKVINNKVKKPAQPDASTKVESTKPTESSSASSVSSKETKNTIVAKAVPDFKAIHQKEEKKMESLGEYLQRKQERFAKLTNSVKTPSSSIKQNPISRLFQKQPSIENSKATSQVNSAASSGLEKPKIKTFAI